MVVSVGVLLPAIAVLGLFYLGTALITEMVSNTAGVVLMLPVGVEVAGQLGANPFAFAMAVSFAASTPLLTGRVPDEYRSTARAGTISPISHGSARRYS